MTVTLVTGGVRSGKSRHAEALVTGDDVTYVATNRPLTAGDDADDEWADRVAAHRARRPVGWTTTESLDVAAAVTGAPGDVVVECLGTWLTGLVDAAAAWDDLRRARTVVCEATAALLEALRHVDGPHVVVVTNEVGLSLVPTTPSGRFFQDELGTLNAAVAAVADHVHLVVAGRVLELPPPGTSTVGRA